MSLIKKNSKNKKEQIKIESPMEKEDKKNKVEEKVEDKKEKEIKKTIKKGSKIIANGRCFGAPSLECPLKTVRNYEAKILDINREYNSVLIDAGWINKDFIK